MKTLIPITAGAMLALALTGPASAEKTTIDAQTFANDPAYCGLGGERKYVVEEGDHLKIAGRTGVLLEDLDNPDNNECEVVLNADAKLTVTGGAKLKGAVRLRVRAAKQGTAPRTRFVVQGSDTAIGTERVDITLFGDDAKATCRDGATLGRVGKGSVATSVVLRAGGNYGRVKVDECHLLATGMVGMNKLGRVRVVASPVGLTEEGDYNEFVGGEVTIKDESVLEGPDVGVRAGFIDDTTKGRKRGRIRIEESVLAGVDTGDISLPPQVGIFSGGLTADGEPGTGVPLRSEENEYETDGDFIVEVDRCRSDDDELNGEEVDICDPESGDGGDGDEDDD